MSVILFFISNTQLQNNPALPSMICESCVAYLKGIEGYKSLVQANQYVLWELLTATKATVSDDENDSRDHNLTKVKEEPIETEFDGCPDPDTSRDHYLTGTEFIPPKIEVKKEEDNIGYHDPFQSVQPFTPLTTPGHNAGAIYDKSNGVPLSCPICNKPQKTFNANGLHMTSVHKVDYSLSYILCCGEKQFAHRFCDHMRYHENPEAFMCHACGVLCQSEWHLMKHQREFHKERGFKCDGCVKCKNILMDLFFHALILIYFSFTDFLSQESMESHREMVHGVECGICGQSEHI